MKFFRNFFMLTFATVAIFFMFGVGSNVVLADINNITKIVFISKAQTVDSGVVSGIITIQTQNSNGGEEDITESSNKLNLSIDSSTGEFSSNGDTWKPVSVITMNKGTANKNFYYKDSSKGSFTITAKLVSGETGKSWTATQNITVGGGDNTTTPDQEENPTAPDATNTPEVINTVVKTVYSVHYIQEDLSDYEEPTVFEVGAGRARLSYVNSPVSFTAKHKVSKDLSAKNCDYVWNFGDGMSLTGEKVEHIYKYAGEYNVILNGTCGGLKSVARTAVKVVMPNISINTKADGAVEISNQGKYEINLYNWKIQSGNTSFVFPQDTIISANKSVTFAPEYLKLTDLNNGIILVDASNKAVAQGSVNFVGTNPSREISFDEFAKFALAYKDASQPTSQHTTLMAATSTPSAIGMSTSPYPMGGKENNPSSSDIIPLTAAASDVIVNNPDKESEPSFWGKLFHPIRTIKESFYQ